jgi:FixJ family two-component response regulator
MLKKALISIVDDDESVREAMQGLMKSLGFAAEAFASAEEFLASDSRNRAACLITDMQMPGLTGLGLHDRLVASGNPVPTIVITAFPDERTRARALQAGVVCHLVKPFNESDLLACIRSVLDRRGEQQSLGERALMRAHFGRRGLDRRNLRMRVRP